MGLRRARSEARGEVIVWVKLFFVFDFDRRCHFKSQFYLHYKKKIIHCSDVSQGCHPSYCIANIYCFPCPRQSLNEGGRGVYISSQPSPASDHLLQVIQSIALLGMLLLFYMELIQIWNSMCFSCPPTNFYPRENTIKPNQTQPNEEHS